MNFKALIILSVLVFGLIPTVKADSTQWYDSSFRYRNVYRIDSDLIDSELIDFPVLVYLNSSYVNWTNINNDLSDLRFVNSDNILLSHEVDNYTENDKAWLWVKIPSISSVIDTVFFMYYGLETALSVEDSVSVWNNDFIGVWHLNDNTTSTILDSTSNNNNGVKKADNEPIEIIGKISNSQNFDGNDDYIEIIKNFSFYNLTVSFWVKSEDIDTISDEYVVDMIRSTSQFTTWVESGGDVARFQVEGEDTGDNSDIYGVTDITDGENHFITAIRDYQNHILYLYIDGVLEKSGIDLSDGIINPNSNLFFGCIYGYTSNYYGLIDEIRLYNVSVSSSWTKADYYSQSLQLIDLTEIESFNDEIYGLALIALMIAIFAFIFVIIISTKMRK